MRGHDIDRQGKFARFLRFNVDERRTKVRKGDLILVLSLWVVSTSVKDHFVAFPPPLELRPHLPIPRCRFTQLVEVVMIGEVIIANLCGFFSREVTCKQRGALCQQETIILAEI